VAAVNRIGHEGPAEGGIEFWGHSSVYDPFGRLLHRASADQEEVIVVACDPKQAETTRQHWPFLRDRRIDAYQPITKRSLPEGNA
jgi:N-carbamoylputrescine amidase